MDKRGFISLGSNLNGIIREKKMTKSFCGGYDSLKHIITVKEESFSTRQKKRTLFTFLKTVFVCHVVVSLKKKKRKKNSIKRDGIALSLQKELFLDLFLRSSFSTWMGFLRCTLLLVYIRSLFLSVFWWFLASFEYGLQEESASDWYQKVRQILASWNKSCFCWMFVFASC